MKKFIKDILHENLKNLINQAGEPSNYLAYHGSSHKITKFSDIFVGGKDARDQEGPGIYFTTSYEDAKGYAGDGGYVYEVNLTPGKLLSNDKKSDEKTLKPQVIKLIKSSKNWERIALSYGDDSEEGLDGMLWKYIDNSRNDKEVFVTLASEVYKSEPGAYVKNMVKLGYDGVYLPSKDGGANIVIYNPKSIKINKSEQI